jgi:hypothetical protein
MNVPSCEEFLKGCDEFERREKRDAMYKMATFLVSHFWGKPSDTADALGVLLLTWNQAFYRYGNFDFDKLEECIARNLKKIEAFRNKDISTMSEKEDNGIKELFIDLLVALQIAYGKLKGRKSPVAVAKALHLLAPKFFPLWDDSIARGYGCHYSDNPADRYIEFCKITKAVAEGVKDCVRQESNKTLVKLIDEYNYSKYTHGWI